MTRCVPVVSTFRGWAGGGGSTFVAIAGVDVVLGMRSAMGELSDDELSDEKLEKRLIADDCFFSR